MSKKHWLILGAIVALGGIGMVIVIALAIGFFFGHETAVGTDPGLPVYTLDQTASTHAG